MIWNKQKSLKLILLPLLILLLSTAILAYDKCGEQIYVNENCTMFSPIINCSGAYDYDIYNASQILIVNNAPMVEVNESMYYFNWTLTSREANFVVKLCDGTIKEIDVVYGLEDKMIAALLIFLPLLFGALLMAGAFLLNKEEHGIFRTLLFIVSFAMIFPSMSFAFASQSLFFPDNVFDSSLTNFLFAAIFIIAVILAYIVFYFMMKILERMAKGKEKYGGGEGNRHE